MTKRARPDNCHKDSEVSPTGRAKEVKDWVGCRCCPKSIPAGTEVCPHCGKRQRDCKQVL